MHCFQIHDGIRLFSTLFWFATHFRRHNLRMCMSMFTFNVDATICISIEFLSILMGARSHRVNGSDGPTRTNSLCLTLSLSRMHIQVYQCVFCEFKKTIRYAIEQWQIWQEWREKKVKKQEQNVQWNGQKM